MSLAGTQRPARFDAPLPRYRTLAVAVRAALYGVGDPLVRHMIERNRTVDSWRALGITL